jgi:hypothetical protein
MSNPKRDDMTEVDVETGNGWDFQSNGREMNDSSAIHHSSQRPDPLHRVKHPRLEFEIASALCARPRLA